MIWWWMSVALAGKVYINGVDVSTLRSQTFDNCTVTFDSKGDVHISAPGYQIEVVDESGDAISPDPAPETPTAPAGSVEATPITPKPTTRPDPTPAASAGSTDPKTEGATGSSEGLPRGTYWLVTEDNGSEGHSVQVYVNDAMVRTVRSGESQVIEDVSRYLRPGDNSIRLVATSIDADGGSFYIYIGKGDNDQGTVVMDAPDVQFGLGKSRSGRNERTYTLTATP